MRILRLAGLAVCAQALLACGKGGETKVMVGGGDAMPAPDASAAAPTFSDDQWALLRSLAPAQLPPPDADVSNAVADNAQAAVFGQKLFFDPGFSGRLLDADNDGGPNTLGKMGQSGKVACVGCHQTQSLFADTRSTFQEISLGAGWTHRRTPALLDVGQAKVVMWGGRFSAIWSQPFGPFENPLEMNSSRLFVAEQIAKRYAADYEAVFGAGSLGDLATSARFPTLTADTTGCKLTQDTPRPRALPPDPLYECHGFPGDKAEYDALAVADQTLVTRVVTNVGKSLEAYERKLTCGASRFDAWVNGDTSALTVSEQRGLAIFIDRGKCATCHSGPYFSDQKFHNVGLKIEVTKEGIFNGNDSGASVDLATAKTDPVGILGPYSDGDDGRLPATIDASYLGAFRTPMLRCVSGRPTYMHTGTMHALEAVATFFAQGGSPDGFLGTSELSSFPLAPQEITDLVSFLKALDGPGPAASLLGPPS